MSLLEPDRAHARAAVVDEHIRCENRHDLDAIMATFGMDARYDDEPWGDYRVGRDGVRSYYTELMRALPDLSIEVKRLARCLGECGVGGDHSRHASRTMARSASDRPPSGVPALRRLWFRRRRQAGVR